MHQPNKKETGILVLIFATGFAVIYLALEFCIKSLVKTICRCIKKWVSKRPAKATAPATVSDLPTPSCFADAENLAPAKELKRNRYGVNPT